MCKFIPVPVSDDGAIGSLGFGRREFKQYSRITVVVDSPNQMHSLVSIIWN